MVGALYMIRPLFWVETGQEEGDEAEEEKLCMSMKTEAGPEAEEGEELRMSLKTEADPEAEEEAGAVSVSLMRGTYSWTLLSAKLTTKTTRFTND